LINYIELLKLEATQLFVVITHRGVERVLARGSSPEPRILNREAERHTEEATQLAERVTQSNEGLTQDLHRAHTEQHKSLPHRGMNLLESWMF